MALIDHVGSGPVGIDTVVFIYFIEEHPAYLTAIEPLFAAIEQGKLKAVTSALTLLETLVVPYRAGNAALAEQYEEILTRSRGLRVVDLDRPFLRRTAQLRSEIPIKTPNALQITAALASNCTAFVTNDRDLPPVPGLPILQLRDHRE